VVCSLKGLKAESEEIMARIIASSASLLMFAACVMLTASHAHAQVPITACATINQPGNYVAENDLVAVLNDGSPRPDCLDIRASHVSINLQGSTISATCSDPYNSSCMNGIDAATPGDTAIHIMSGADHVTLSNIDVLPKFENAIVDDANFASVTTATLGAFDGVILNSASHSNFRDISYSAPYAFQSGQTFLAINGGSLNTFSTLNVGTSSSQAIPPTYVAVITNSNFNAITGLSAYGFHYFCGAASISLASSSFNAIANSQLEVNCGTGIEIEAGSNYNLVYNNGFVEEFTPEVFYAAVDGNANCGKDLWIDNTFVGLVSPTSCIH
jgi:hypothetical protein